eukprot:jgi/Tetstr1/446079/TSEL_033680.t1
MADSIGGDFGRLEYEAWGDEAVAAAYDGGFGPLTRQAIPALLDRALGADAAGAAAPRRVLDVATGPGYVAASAAARGHRVVGLDCSDAFLKMAAKLCAAAAGESGVQLVQGDAQALPFGDAEFDAVCCSFGVLHLPEPQVFFREACRVLKPGGVLAFTVWQAPPATAGFDICLQAVREHGNPDVPLPPGPSFFLYANPETARQQLEEAGMCEVQSQTVPMTLRLERPGDLIQLLQEGTARTRALLTAQTASDLANIQAAVTQACTAAGLVLPMPCALVSARKPAGP